MVTAYDDSGRISTVTGTGNKTYASDMAYAAHGASVRMRTRNGLWQTAEYNSRLQPHVLRLVSWDGGLDKLGLTYEYGTNDNNGNVRSQQIASPVGTWLQEYEYDGLNRLRYVDEGARVQTYGYDRYGNRWVESGPVIPNSQLTPRSQDAFNASNNRLVASGYDYAGNQTSDALLRNFGYDAENRQTSYNNGQASYQYDGDGHRVHKLEGGVDTWFVYDALGRLAAEYSTQMLESAGTTYIMQDHLGSTRVTTNETGGVIARYDYLPFGEEMPSAAPGDPRYGVPGYGAPDDTHQRFSGKERDAESGLDYFGARYFSGAQGRFTSLDFHGQPFA
ncbi:MAG: hypothetical protein LAP85_16830 [Acidobacteriia bacterium]|nr:hypothetical protein [Terriglobia bacterium]